MILSSKLFSEKIKWQESIYKIWNFSLNYYLLAEEGTYAVSKSFSFWNHFKNVPHLHDQPPQIFPKFDVLHLIKATNNL